jgi:hypothetical protein
MINRAGSEIGTMPVEHFMRYGKQAGFLPVRTCSVCGNEAVIDSGSFSLCEACGWESI